jgi:hypothetical protein
MIESLARFTVADSKGSEDLGCLMIAGGHSTSGLCTDANVNDVHGAQGFPCLGLREGRLSIGLQAKK